jgi:DNA-binding transcriptional regulator YdaS (Cro superfamily)
MRVLERAIKASGGLSKFAALMGVSPQVVVNWRKRGIPVERALEVEEKTRGTRFAITASEVLHFAKHQREAA